jgi:hypothetical protein
MYWRSRWFLSIFCFELKQNWVHSDSGHWFPMRHLSRMVYMREDMGQRLQGCQSPLISSHIEYFVCRASFGGCMDVRNKHPAYVLWGLGNDAQKWYISDHAEIWYNCHLFHFRRFDFLVFTTINMKGELLRISRCYAFSPGQLWVLAVTISHHVVLWPLNEIICWNTENIFIIFSCCSVRGLTEQHPGK